jgi:hypothetical protein
VEVEVEVEVELEGAKGAKGGLLRWVKRDAPVWAARLQMWMCGVVERAVG